MSRSVAAAGLGLVVFLSVWGMTALLSSDSPESTELAPASQSQLSGTPTTTSSTPTDKKILSQKPSGEFEKDAALLTKQMRTLTKGPAKEYLQDLLPLLGANESSKKDNNTASPSASEVLKLLMKSYGDNAGEMIGNLNTLLKELGELEDGDNRNLESLNNRMRELFQALQEKGSAVPYLQAPESGDHKPAP